MCPSERDSPVVLILILFILESQITAAKYRAKRVGGSMENKNGIKGVGGKGRMGEG